jgi:hypothetical protein
MLGTLSETVVCPGGLTIQSGTSSALISYNNSGTNNQLEITNNVISGKIRFTVTNTGGGINRVMDILPDSVNISQNLILIPGGSKNITFSDSTLQTTAFLGSNSLFGSLVIGQATVAAANYIINNQTTKSITTGTGNTIYGMSGGSVVTTGNGNTSIGTNALTVATTSSYNTCIGLNSGKAITTGTGNNVSIGANSNTGGTTLYYSTALGASSSNANYSNSTALGYSATNTASNQLMLGTAKNRLFSQEQLV